MEFYIKQNIDENIVQYVFKANDNTLHGICVDKNVSLEDAYQTMINFVEPIESPLGLS